MEDERQARLAALRVAAAALRSEYAALRDELETGKLTTDGFVALARPVVIELKAVVAEMRAPSTGQRGETDGGA